MIVVVDVLLSLVSLMAETEMRKKKFVWICYAMEERKEKGKSLEEKMGKKL